MYNVSGEAHKLRDVVGKLLFKALISTSLASSLNWSSLLIASASFNVAMCLQSNDNDSFCDQRNVPIQWQIWNFTLLDKKKTIDSFWYFFFQREFISRGVAKNLIKRYNQRVLQLFLSRQNWRQAQLHRTFRFLQFPSLEFGKLPFSATDVAALVRDMQMSETRCSPQSFRPQLYTLNALYRCRISSIFVGGPISENFSSRRVCVYAPKYFMKIAIRFCACGLGRISEGSAISRGRFTRTLLCTR